VPPIPNDPDDIRRRMALIRRDLHADVQGVVAKAEAAADWRRYLTMYPWVSLGAALALGYWIVPKRSPQAISYVESAPPPPVAPSAREEAVVQKKGLLGAAVGMVAPLAIRLAQGYALKLLDQWYKELHTHQSQAGPSPAQRGPGRASSGASPPGPAGGRPTPRPSGPGS
jgi:hypothetical protein